MDPTLSQKLRYLVFEGVDGVGKTSLLSHVHAELIARTAWTDSKPVMFTEMRFPTTSPVGVLIRRVLTNYEYLDERTMLYLWMADAVEANTEITVRLASGQYVLTDRHPFVSSFAYQAESYDMATLLAIQAKHTLVSPHHVFILDAPTDVTETRLQRRTETRCQRYEPVDAAYRERIRQRYLAYATLHPQHTTVLNGIEPVTTLVQQVMQHLTEKP